MKPKEGVVLQIVDRVIEDLRTEPEIDLPYGLRENILANIDELSFKPSPLPLRLLRISAVALAGLILVILLSRVFHRETKISVEQPELVWRNGEVGAFISWVIDEAKAESASEFLSSKTSNLLIGVKK